MAVWLATLHSALCFSKNQLRFYIFSRISYKCNAHANLNAFFIKRGACYNRANMEYKIHFLKWKLFLNELMCEKVLN